MGSGQFLTGTVVPMDGGIQFFDRSKIPVMTRPGSNSSSFSNSYNSHKRIKCPSLYIKIQKYLPDCPDKQTFVFYLARIFYVYALATVIVLTVSLASKELFGGRS